LSEEVWILLTRHRIDTRRLSEFISLHAEYDDGHPDTPKSFADTSRTQGVYTDNPHVLVRTITQGKAAPKTDIDVKVRVTVPPSDASSTISLNASYDGPFDDVGFTVTAYSRLTMRWDETPRKLPFDLRVSGCSVSQDIRRKSHPVHVHAKPAVPPARAPHDDATRTVGENADRGRVARAARRARQRDGHLGPRRACLRVRNPRIPAFRETFEF
jgi:hypothetical protein